MPKTPLPEPIGYAPIVASADTAASTALISSGLTAICASYVCHLSRCCAQATVAKASMGNASESSTRIGPAASETVYLLTAENHINTPM